MEASTDRRRPTRGSKQRRRRQQRQANFTAFDRALRHASEKQGKLVLHLTVEEEAIDCWINEVDQYFIRVTINNGGAFTEEWINKAHIVRCRISTGEDS